MMGLHSLVFRHRQDKLLLKCSSFIIESSEGEGVEENTPWLQSGSCCCCFTFSTELTGVLHFLAIASGTFQGPSQL